MLNQVALGYSLVVDGKRQVVAHRLNVAPARPDAPVDAGALLGALAEVWPQAQAAAARPGMAGGAALRKGSVVLNVAGEGLLMGLLHAQTQALTNAQASDQAVDQTQPPMPSVVIEVPAFLMQDPAISGTVRAAQAAGVAMWIKGRGAVELATGLKGFFSHVLCENAEAFTTRCAVPWVHAGIGNLAAWDESARKGLSLGAGWPLVEVKPTSSSRPKVAPEMQVVMELIGRIDREEPIERLEATLKADASLAFRLLRYLNSPAFGLAVEVSSFRHAVMMLGYAKLKRWLGLLLVSASKDPNQVPVMHTAVRRGLLMEELGRGSGDAEMRGELFLCGVFSLLDRMLQQPIAELFASLPMPERVRQALGDGQGPFVPYLQLVQAVESGSPFDRQEAADALLLDVSEVNRALLAALATARQLEA